jgi:putative phosphoribosyl transferase
MDIFNDRTDAGKRLVAAMPNFRGRDVIVLAIPRGGVVVGFEIAKALGFPLDVIIPRKIGAPGNPELAIGAVTEDGNIILDDEIVNYLGVTQEFIEEESERQKQEINRRLKLYRKDEPYPELAGLTVILVDDGIATGSTMKAALESVKKKGAENVFVAVPVGPPSTIAELKKRADAVFCLLTPEAFDAIGEFYRNFEQTTDEEVIALLIDNKNSTSFGPKKATMP